MSVVSLVTVRFVALVALVTVTPAITVFKAVPLTVMASASRVPYISTSPEKSPLAASNSPPMVKLPELGL